MAKTQKGSIRYMRIKTNIKKLLFISLLFSSSAFSDSDSIYLKCDITLKPEVIPVFLLDGECWDDAKCKSINFKPIEIQRGGFWWSLGYRFEYMHNVGKLIPSESCSFDADDDYSVKNQFDFRLMLPKRGYGDKKGMICPSKKKFNTYSFDDLLTKRIDVDWKQVESRMMQAINKQNLENEKPNTYPKAINIESTDFIPKNIDFLIIKIIKNMKRRGEYNYDSAAFYWDSTQEPKHPSNDTWDPLETYRVPLKRGIDYERLNFNNDKDWEYPYGYRDEYKMNKDFYYNDRGIKWLGGSSMPEKVQTINRKTLVYRSTPFSSNFYQCSLSDKQTNDEIFKAYSEILNRADSFATKLMIKAKRDKEEELRIKEESEPLNQI